MLAVHIAENVLRREWLALGGLLAVILLAWSARRLNEDNIPLLAVLSAVFFIASSVHIRLGPTSAHLLMNAPLGILLRRLSPVAILIGLTLQAFLLTHGGPTSLGVNVLIFSIPALLGAKLFDLTRRWLKPWGAGVLTGFCVVASTAILNAFTLWLFGREDLRNVAVFVILWHLPLAFVEAIFTGGLCRYLSKARPAWLAHQKMFSRRDAEVAEKTED